MVKKIILGFVAGVVGAVAFDFQKYYEALDKAADMLDPTVDWESVMPKFDWKLAVIRWIKGGVTGAIGAAGLGGLE
jgi:hypothetical protein